MLVHLHVWVLLFAPIPVVHRNLHHLQNLHCWAPGLVAVAPCIFLLPCLSELLMELSDVDGKILSVNLETDLDIWTI